MLKDLQNVGDLSVSHLSKLSTLQRELALFESDAQGLGGEWPLLLLPTSGHRSCCANVVP